MSKKKPTNFRLSEDNIKLINEISNAFNFNQTEVLEFILALVRKQPELFIKSFEIEFKRLIKEITK